MDPIYVYDLNGNRITMIDPTGLTTYNYDVLNRLTSITNNQGLTTTFTYDALGRRTSMTHDNGVVTNYTYDAASQLLSLVHQLGASTINSFTYAYDKVGNRKTKADNNGTANYTYDTLNRLINATNPLPSNPLESFTYDEVGNRTDSNQNGLSNFDGANQLTDDADFTYEYDLNGNQTRKTNKVTGAFTLYEYDAENKLIRVVREDGSIVNYKYDGFGRRIEKEVDSVVSQYIYDREDILLELDGSNNIVARYTHGPGIDEPLIIEKNGVSSFYHADGLGSITELSNVNGSIVKSYSYSSFGKTESETNPTFFQPYTFTAREFDEETDLYHNRARYYDARTGLFLQEDPIGLAVGDVNLYNYVGNNPINLVDPFGYQTIASPTPFGLPIVLPNNQPTKLSAQQAREFNEFLGLFSPKPFLQFLFAAFKPKERKLVETIAQPERRGSFRINDPRDFLRICLEGCKVLQTLAKRITGRIYCVIATIGQLFNSSNLPPSPGGLAGG